MSEARFEDELSAVEDIVRKLERGEIGLDDALQLFEDGIARLRALETRLTDAEARVRAVLERAGILVEEPIDADDR
jgi:exodeoxyribonuclease VII small subunit